MRQIQLIGWFYLPVGSFRFPVDLFHSNTRVKVNHRSKILLAKRKVMASNGKTLLPDFDILLHL
ncbi:MAG: hypothetical protein IPN60_06940 [Saprospiraceae bacterium]|nr:hypothetical protein [Candidatus Opimibacter skivensis]